MAMKPIEILINAKDNASSVFDGLKSKLTAVGAAVAAYFGVSAFVGAVKGAADFEAGMSRVQAATGASALEMAKLRQAAEDAGANTKYTSTEAAAALETLAKAGLSASDAIAALPAVLNLAQAGDIELATASEFVTKAVMGMGLAFTDAGRVADVLALGANATNTSVTGLAQALSYAAPVANSLGVSLESTVAIIGKFADAGIDASRAGTALNSIMSQFSDPASKFRQALGAAGITTNNFEEALHQLAKAGPNGAKAIAAVGQEAGPALRALLNQGMGSLDELTKKLNAAAGSAAATAKVMQDNLNGSLTGLSSAWDTLKNALATPVLPVLKDGVDQLAEAFRGAVENGTIKKFGDSIATAFQAGIKFARDFIGTIDFDAVVAKLQGFADDANKYFAMAAEYATNAGGTIKTAYGVMATGANTVLAGIYGLGIAFAEVSLGIVKASLTLNEALEKIAIGYAKKRLQEDAEVMRGALAGLAGVSEEFGKKTEQAMRDATRAAGIAQDGFSGLTKGVADSKSAADGAAGAMAAMAKELTAGAEAAAAAGVAYQKKASADQVAKKASDDHTTALRQLRQEYDDLIAGGNVQAAAEKIKEINKALQATPAASKAAEEAVKVLNAAYAELGLKSRDELQNIAKNAVDAFEKIAKAGQAEGESYMAWQARKAEGAKVMLTRMIDANGGIADAAIKTRAAMERLEIQVDGTGQATVKAMGEGQKAVAALGEQFKMTTEQIKASEEAMDRLMMKYTLSADYTERQIALLEKENALVERRNALERERLSIDKEGFSVDPKTGQRVNMQIDNQRSVYERAKTQGLTEAQALQVSRQFMTDRGEKIGWNDGGRNGARQGETWDTALQKEINRQVLTNAQTNAGDTGQTKTYKVDLNINGQRDSFAMASDADASRLVAALKNAQLVAR